MWKCEWGYDVQDRKLVTPGNTSDGKDINMWWWTGQLSYAF